MHMLFLYIYDKYTYIDDIYYMHMYAYAYVCMQMYVCVT